MYITYIHCESSSNTKHNKQFGVILCASALFVCHFCVIFFDSCFLLRTCCICLRQKRHLRVQVCIYVVDGQYSELHSRGDDDRRPCRGHHGVSEQQKETNNFWMSSIYSSNTGTLNPSAPQTEAWTMSPALGSVWVRVRSRSPRHALPLYKRASSSLAGLNQRTTDLSDPPIRQWAIPSPDPPMGAGMLGVCVERRSRCGETRRSAKIVCLVVVCVAVELEL